MQILLVEDEVELAEPLSRVLRNAAYQVDVAYDGETALDRLQAAITNQHGYDLLILDWMLPRLSGLEICQRLRSEGNAIPVLFLTAKDTLDDRVQGLDAGADDYLVKPFELRELLARVRALLRRGTAVTETGAIADTPLPTHDLELDREGQILYRQGRAISLSEKESQLLAFLIEHPHQLLTHEEIYQHLWPGDEKPGSNVLAAQIRLLRRKIETPGETPLIHTVYGKGYRFAPDPQANPEL
jgi:two-component system, OmpR family, manganese sensing response regulator